VDYFPPNAYGLHGMAGNLAEFIWNGRNPNPLFEDSPTPEELSGRMVFTRGASWNTEVVNNGDTINDPNPNLEFNNQSSLTGVRMAMGSFAPTRLPPVITSQVTASGIQGQHFGFQVTAVNEASQFSATGLPEGLKLNRWTGSITGTPLHSGVFQIDLTASNSIGTGTATLTLNVAPPGMRPIPTGTYVRVLANGQGESYEFGTRYVYISDFLMDQTEVTNEQMAAALQWAFDQGLVSVEDNKVRNVQGDSRILMDLAQTDCRLTWDDSNSIFGIKTDKGVGYPCVEVSWYGAVAYCNFRTLMENPGRTPCYDFSDWSCDWNATGYRLPTESECEKAARGGLEEKRFPWGDTITHEQANYRSDANIFYDTSETRGLHPTWNQGGSPGTSPVGSFPPNGYGLYDMAGNVQEWCWDRFGGEWSNYPLAERDPKGPDTGTIANVRMFRGGEWFANAYQLRCSFRAYLGEETFGWNLGFRTVLATRPQ